MLGGLGKALGRIAPVLGRAAAKAVPGGAVAELLVSAVADRLGLSTRDPDAVAAAVEQASDDDKVRLRELETELERDLARTGLARAKVAAADRAGARRMALASGSWTTPTLAVMIVVGFFGVAGWIVWEMMHVEGEIDQVTSNIVFSLLSYVAGLATSVVTFYFGASNQPAAAPPRGK